MAASFTVFELRMDRQVRFAGSDDKLKITWTTQYRVEVSGTAEEIRDVSPVDVCQASGLPLVNRSIYYFNGKIIPYVVCRDKHAKQNPAKLSHWIVTARYETNEPTDRNESQEQEIDPPASIDDLTPRVEIEFGETERVLYLDKKDQSITTPTGNFYAQPAIERVPIKILKITQYDHFISFNDMHDRKFKCNEEPYRGDGRYQWFIEEVTAIDAIVQLQSGPVEVAQVTYELHFNPMTDENGDVIGWFEERALIDTHYMDGTKKKPIVDDLTKTETIGFIDINGAWLKTAVKPDYERFELYETRDFDSFLKA